jgi:hypothetical protein
MSEPKEPQPHDRSYKGTPFKPTPEQVAMVRRWVAEQDAVLKERPRKLSRLSADQAAAPLAGGVDQ